MLIYCRAAIISGISNRRQCGISQGAAATALALSLGGLLGLVTTARAQSARSVGTVRTIRQVLVTTGAAGPSAAYVPAHDKQGVGVGQGLRTLKRAQAEIDFFDSSILRVNERTDLIVEDTPNLHNVRLNGGIVWVRDGKGAHTQVETPSATAVARGTTFTVDVTSNGSTVIEVFDGVVDVTVGGKTVSVGAGQKLTVSGSGATPVTYTTPDNASPIPANELPVGYGGGSYPWYLEMVDNLGVGVTAGTSAVLDQRTSALGEALQQLSSAAPNVSLPQRSSGGLNPFDQNIFFQNAQSTLVTDIQQSGLSESQYQAQFGSETLAQAGFSTAQITALNGIGITTLGQAVQALSDNGANVSVTTPTGRRQTTQLAANRSIYDFRQINGQPDYDYRLLDQNTTSLAFVGVGGALALLADAGHLHFPLPTLSGQAFGFFNDPDLIGGRARLDGYVSDKTHYALEGNAIRVLTGNNTGWNTKPDSVAVVEQTISDGVTLFAGRRRFYDGPVFQDEVNSQLIADRYTGAGAVFHANGFKAEAAYLYDDNPVVGGAQHGAMVSANRPIGAGIVGLNYLNVPKIGDNTGITVNGTYPVIPGQLEAYAEVGRGPDKATLQTYGTYFPGVYQATDFDLFIEYGDHEHVGQALSVVLNRDIKKLLSLRGYVSLHDHNNTRAGAAAIFKFGTR